MRGKVLKFLPQLALLNQSALQCIEYLSVWIYICLQICSSPQDSGPLEDEKQGISRMEDQKLDEHEVGVEQNFVSWQK